MSILYGSTSINCWNGFLIVPKRLHYFSILLKTFRCGLDSTHPLHILSLFVFLKVFSLVVLTSFFPAMCLSLDVSLISPLQYPDFSYPSICLPSCRFRFFVCEDFVLTSFCHRVVLPSYSFVQTHMSSNIDRWVFLGMRVFCFTPGVHVSLAMADSSSYDP